MAPLLRVEGLSCLRLSRLAWICWLTRGVDVVKRPITLENQGHRAQGPQNRTRYPHKQNTKIEEGLVHQMMAGSLWLWPKDLEFVKSVSRQLEEGRRTEPSYKQAKVIRDIHRRWEKNQEPRFVQGGSPGGGRRR